VEACLITLRGKPRRFPPDVHEKLQPYLSETDG